MHDTFSPPTVCPAFRRRPLVTAAYLRYYAVGSICTPLYVGNSLHINVYNFVCHLVEQLIVLDCRLTWD